MYPPLALNGLKTRPGLPGTGLATGNCVPLADFCADGAGFADGLLVAARDGGRFDLCDAARGVGEGPATGWPGLVTSDAAVAGAGSRWPKTRRPRAVMTR